VSPGATFERVYLTLKEELGSGRFRPGEQLEPAVLSEELNSSITPVRDALHRLVGERLVQAPRNDGFRAPLLTEAALRDLYAWNLQLLLMACRSGRNTPAKTQDVIDVSAAGGDAAQLALAANRLFAGIASLSPSAEHQRAIGALSDRLRAVRQAEPALFANAAEELGALESAFIQVDLPGLRRLLSAYHRARARRVSALLDLLQPLP
jgi:DNA-binding FadR family transcriptional regulator